MQYLSLIQPAILITVSAILIRFFGKVISDQKPFSDDRNWEIELNGLNFFLRFIIFYGVIGFWVASKWNAFDYVNYWTTFILVSFLGGWPVFSAFTLGLKNYQISIPPIKKINKKGGFVGEIQIFQNKFIKWIERTAKYVPLRLFAVLFVYVLISAFKKDNILWLLIFTAEICPLYISLAVISSLKKYRPQKANIYLIGQTEPILDIQLLKVNNDNIRYRQEEKVIIMNRSRVEKIEILVIKNAQKK